MMKNNKIWVYTICYNESHFVKNFLAAYEDAEKIVVYDNMSTDNSVELLTQDSRVEIRQFDSGNKIRNDLHMNIKNDCWEEARGKADWVIAVDFDEIFTRIRMVDGVVVYDLDLTDAYCNDWNIIKPYGYDMVSFESPLYSEGHPYIYSKKGVDHPPSYKMCCFRPDKISKMNYGAGCHEANPLDMDGYIENIRVLINEDFKLLHYRFWNIDHYIRRIIDYKTRASEQDEERGWGFHRKYSMEEHYALFVANSILAKPLFENVITKEQSLNLAREERLKMFIKCYE